MEVSICCSMRTCKGHWTCFWFSESCLGISPCDWRRWASTDAPSARISRGLPAFQLEMIILLRNQLLWDLTLVWPLINPTHCRSWGSKLHCCCLTVDLLVKDLSPFVCVVVASARLCVVWEILSVWHVWCIPDIVWEFKATPGNFFFFFTTHGLSSCST